MTEDIMWLWFNNIDGIGLTSRLRIMSKLKNIDRVHEANKEQLQDILKNNQINTFMNSKKDINKYIELKEKLMERNVWFVYPGHKDYPIKLYDIYEPPTLLYVKGNINNSINSQNVNIAIVGSRKPSVYGSEMAMKFAKDLAGHGINIISGLASGIDSKAHCGSLLAGGYTIGILGCGINLTYPRENAELYAKISKNGAILSEYGLDVGPVPGYFPMRNRLISGLSDGVLVVEAKKKSGSLITADYALEQGKQVYAIPGKLLDSNSEGTNNLIKEGAYLVTSYKDIMFDLTKQEEYKDSDICSEQNSIRASDEKKRVNKNFLAPIEKMVYSCLSLEPTYIDDIIQTIGIGVTKTISVLYTMEEKGFIKQPVKGYYIISI
ncbi:MAG: DNA-processing protein DprA [Lachnospiraceae bacterium]|nr:DNA-processing protein DprA [Lachnospiraceae bacterium]